MVTNNQVSFKNHWRKLPQLAIALSQLLQLSCGELKPPLSKKSQSQIRPADQDYSVLFEEHKHQSDDKPGRVLDHTQSYADVTALDGASTKISQIHKSPHEHTLSEDEIQKIHTYVRDQKVFHSKESGTIARRITWLYPDDGCFSRASVMFHLFGKHRLAKTILSAFSKVFVFGNLQLDTTYHKEGKVSWWYHVAPGFVHRDQFLVMDPAVNAQKPMRLVEWIEALHEKTSTVKLAVCDQNAYSPSSVCAGNDSHFDASQGIRDQKEFLPIEWERLDDLGLDPKKVLGSNPPWHK